MPLYLYEPGYRSYTEHLTVLYTKKSRSLVVNLCCRSIFFLANVIKHDQITLLTRWTLLSFGSELSGVRCALNWTVNDHTVTWVVLL